MFKDLVQDYFLGGEEVTGTFGSGRLDSRGNCSSDLREKGGIDGDSLAPIIMATNWG